MAVQYDHLFISDQHISLGYDQTKRTFNRREDFFFDDTFFRWLRWADKACAADRRWELVFVGDAFDFLPIEMETINQYIAAQERRWQEQDPDDHRAAVAYWQQQFAKGSETPEWLQWLLFEDDLLAGRVRLEPVSPMAMDMTAPAAPDWTVHLYSELDPKLLESARAISPSFGLGQPQEERSVAFQIAEGHSPPSRREQARDRAFERRYGFLPTQSASMVRLHFIYQGHRTFFRAMAWFVAHGHRIVFVRGNHDLEIFWPGVQDLIRRLVTQEHAALVNPPPLPDLEQAISFAPGWFYYKPGLFYAEHGSQYEPLDSVPHPIRPLLPDDPHILNPPVGSLGVTCIHTKLEDDYPEWENRGQMAFSMLQLARQHPLQALSIVIRHGIDFLWMARRLWRVQKMQHPQPSPEEFAAYGRRVGLEAETVQAIYNEMVAPLLLRGFTTWLLFSPLGHVVKAILLLLAVVALAAWYVVAIPAIAALIPNQSLELLVELFLWLGLPALISKRWGQKASKSGDDPFLFHAAQRVHSHLKQEDDAIHLYVMGHTHRAETCIVERRSNARHAYYMNTGCWFPEFAADTRRLQTLGREVEFTFIRLRQLPDGPQADLMRWNDLSKSVS